MTYDRLVGLRVINDSVYQQYRDAMGPVLKSYGGRFSYDFRVAEVLKAESGVEMNRVFVIRFPDSEAMETFFNDPDYLSIRARFFDTSVAETTIIATYENPEIDLA